MGLYRLAGKSRWCLSAGRPHASAEPELFCRFSTPTLLPPHHPTPFSFSPPNKHGVSVSHSKCSYLTPSPTFTSLSFVSAFEAWVKTHNLIHCAYSDTDYKSGFIWHGILSAYVICPTSKTSSKFLSLWKYGFLGSCLSSSFRKVGFLMSHFLHACHSQPLRACWAALQFRTHQMIFTHTHIQSPYTL